jgi:hypothetical protein
VLVAGERGGRRLLQQQVRPGLERDRGQLLVRVDGRDQDGDLRAGAGDQRAEVVGLLRLAEPGQLAGRRWPGVAHADQTHQPRPGQPPQVGQMPGAVPVHTGQNHPDRVHPFTAPADRPVTR